ncbi:MAG: hypothetical protein ACI310_02310 [Bacilli bacterium]
MQKTNRFHTKKIDKQNITVEEERKHHSPFILFLIRNGKLILTISLLFSLSVFIIAFSLTMTNIKESSIVKYKSNGVMVKFDSSDEMVLNGTPITLEYADKLFDSSVQNSNYEGVIIKIKEASCKFGNIVFYSDKTALIKYIDGTYMRIYSVNNNYGVDEEGIINSKAVTKKLTGEIKQNNLGINILYLSDGSTEITYKDSTIFVRNGDISNLEDKFYTNLSLISIKLKEENNKIYYSNNIIKENNLLNVDNKTYKITSEKVVTENIKIIYYENGYAEVIKDKLSIIVEKSEHIKYDNNIFEIVSQDKEKVDIKDLMDIKSITIDNTNTETINYIVVLEETNNYQKHNINKRLASEYIRFSTYINGNTYKNNILNNNLRGKEGYTFNNNTYLLYEGKLDKLSSININIGMWIDYETITNEYMNSAFIGTMKVYVETSK